MHLLHCAIKVGNSALTVWCRFDPSLQARLPMEEWDS